MSPDSRKVLWDATEDAQRILRIAVGKTFADYSHDEWLRAAIERHFIILGEALFRLRQSDAEPANQLTELPRTLALRDQGQDCQPHEIVLTVADHLSILTCELTGQAYNKSAHRRQLMQGLPGRTAGAVEFEHANISAVMLPLGFPYIKGYQPRANFQRAALLHAVSEQVAQHLVLDEAALSAEQRPVAAVELADFSRVKTKAPKREQVAREAPPPAYLRPVIQRDYLARETLSRLLGLAGEEFALRFERWRLIQLGQASRPNGWRISPRLKVMGWGTTFVPSKPMASSVSSRSRRPALVSARPSSFRPTSRALPRTTRRDSGCIGCLTSGWHRASLSWMARSTVTACSMRPPTAPPSRPEALAG